MIPPKDFIIKTSYIIIMAENVTTNFLFFLSV